MELQHAEMLLAATTVTTITVLTALTVELTDRVAKKYLDYKYKG